MYSFQARCRSCKPILQLLQQIACDPRVLTKQDQSPNQCALAGVESCAQERRDVPDNFCIAEGGTLFAGIVGHDRHKVSTVEHSAFALGPLQNAAFQGFSPSQHAVIRRAWNIDGAKPNLPGTGVAVQLVDQFSDRNAARAIIAKEQTDGEGL